jgi:hypothetical protein
MQERGEHRQAETALPALDEAASVIEKTEAACR